MDPEPADLDIHFFQNMVKNFEKVAHKMGLLGCIQYLQL